MSSKDEQIELRGLKGIEKLPYPLWRIEVLDSETAQRLCLDYQSYRFRGHDCGHL